MPLFLFERSLSSQRTSHNKEFSFARASNQKKGSLRRVPSATIFCFSYESLKVHKLNTTGFAYKFTSCNQIYLMIEKSIYPLFYNNSWLNFTMYALIKKWTLRLVESNLLNLMSVLLKIIY
ncbi:hypothetical protein CISIN_1g033403mg [Citrus sinensis]|uniref:Uncharacterized protein n=1 Tax=Citrus sinensis TaxID=2711 RepID=A0A067GF07_CITSI|nr:hypothetical protein CISIN_1g033403mg [Citrus sinensis]